MNEPLIVIACDNERRLVEQLGLQGDIIVTGVGGLNIYRALESVPRYTPIINVGYAGAVGYEIGEVKKIGTASLYHPHCSYQEPVFRIAEDEVAWCYTSNDFVTSTPFAHPCLFDMELAFICAMGFKQVDAYKCVSDHCNYDDYEKTARNGQISAVNEKTNKLPD